MYPSNTASCFICLGNTVLVRGTTWLKPHSGFLHWRRPGGLVTSAVEHCATNNTLVHAEQRAMNGRSAAGQPLAHRRDAAVRSRPAARSVVALPATKPQRHTHAAAPLQPWHSTACLPSTRRVTTQAKKQDPLILRSVDDDPAIDALIFEEVGHWAHPTSVSLNTSQDTAVMAERALETAAAYVGAAVLFGIGVWFFLGATAGQEFFAGYLLEQSLSIDNLFVFILVFKYFKYVLLPCAITQ